LTCILTISFFSCAAGESGVDQLVEIIKVLGTPTKEEIHAMNPNYTEFKFPQIKAHPWTKVFSKRMPVDAIDLVSAVGWSVLDLISELQEAPQFLARAVECVITVLSAVLLCV
jgi:hypothetical protein